ncbi:hypothetical protein [Undibacterium luofuense]|uniref:Uncharacterized protein n=1 Tax=Undibacterium luofuense TaxID=2828733 RepID=A0A941DM74_9BURK|nr:hypothetical protein [Undibacterium luofuense]MBR7782594.1 hypothetical protein [Undibacterium luofuense]
MKSEKSAKNCLSLTKTLPDLNSLANDLRTQVPNILDNIALPDTVIASSLKLPPSAIQQAQELSEKWAELGNTMEQLKQSFQLPLAVNALSSSLGLTNVISNHSSKFSDVILPKLKLNLPTFDIDWDAINARDERALRFAAQHNWFIQPETSCTFAAEIDKCDGDPALLDQMFSAMIRSFKSEIMERLTCSHTAHAPLIAEMSKLHDEQRYLAAIPLALIAAEGIAHKVTEKSIFNIKQNRPEIAKWLDDQDISKLTKAFLVSLTEQHPMSKPRPGKLSRHRVLHGTDPDYGCELFSLQAISLLGFVGWAFAPDGLLKSKSQESFVKETLT